ncbi:MAG TPA: flagellar export chaperone FliS [Myxococcota bacterium]|jgi:flagellar biosynthetic protein FliS
MSAVARYRKDQVETATRPRIMVMLFEKALSCMALAQKSVDAREYERLLSRSCDIVIELQRSLDPQHEEVLCKTLDGLYSFVLQRLFEARRTRDNKKVVDAHRALAPIADAFAQAIAL